jgi:hypothetical protein
MKMHAINDTRHKMGWKSNVERVDQNQGFGFRLNEIATVIEGVKKFGRE